LQAVHYCGSRATAADRDRYAADPTSDVPVAGLLAPAYLADRASLVAADKSLVRAQPGRPAGAARSALADGVEADLASTTHFSIVDAEGNAVALTSSIEFLFGNHRFVRGFLLTNELTISFVAGGRATGRDRVEGARSAQFDVPTLVFDADGRRMIDRPVGTRSSTTRRAS
jgi:gamma-glutamyltranspeptidase/glutathione hydrolase